MRPAKFSRVVDKLSTHMGQEMDGKFNFGIKEGMKDFFLLTLEPFGKY
jgi:hypothetical protein